MPRRKSSKRRNTSLSRSSDGDWNADKTNNQASRDMTNKKPDSRDDFTKPKWVRSKSSQGSSRNANKFSTWKFSNFDFKKAVDRRWRQVTWNDRSGNWMVVGDGGKEDLLMLTLTLSMNSIGLHVLERRSKKELMTLSLFGNSNPIRILIDEGPGLKLMIISCINGNDIYTNMISQDHDTENTYFVSNTSKFETSMV
ncbi:hypothetical protein LXL04_028424 [Taraxacum kok-saghyz]